MWRCLSYLSGEGAAASHDVRARGRVGARGQASTPGRAAGEVLPDPHRSPAPLHTDTRSLYYISKYIQSVLYFSAFQTFRQSTYSKINEID